MVHSGFSVRYTDRICIMSRNINEPGFDDDGIYRDKKKDDEEEKIIPVEYLSFVQRKRKQRIAHISWTILLILVLVGIAPSTKGVKICPRCGRTHAFNTLAWGHWSIPSLEIVDSKWTEWYESLNPEPHDHHWVYTGKTHPGLFIFITFPFPTDQGWEFPENLVERMRELSQPRYFRPGKVLDIPRVLEAVNNGREWNAIILPLSLGTPDQAFQFWQRHERELLIWAEKIKGTPIPESFLQASDAYVEKMTEPVGHVIPLTDH